MRLGVNTKQEEVYMQYHLIINQQKAIEWGLDLKLAGLFAFLYEVPSWATSVNVGGETWFWISRSKILEEVPVLGVTKNSVYRYMKALEEKGLIVLGKDKSIGMTLIQLTDKAREWNRKSCNTYCNSDDAPIAKLQKPYCNSDDVSYNHISTNQVDNKTLVPSDDGTPVSRKNEYPDDFEATWRTYPKRAGGNPKRSAFKAWSARIKNGATTEEILLGVERYRKFIAATGKQNTEFVMQAATFFGPDERFREDWNAPAQASKGNGMAQPLKQGSYTPADDDLPDWLKDMGEGQ